MQKTTNQLFSSKLQHKKYSYCLYLDPALPSSLKVINFVMVQLCVRSAFKNYRNLYERMYFECFAYMMMNEVPIFQVNTHTVFHSGLKSEKKCNLGKFKY